MSLLLLAALSIACAATYSRAFVRMNQNEREVKLLMSHRGQVRWFAYRIFEKPWTISKVTPGAEGKSIQLDLSGPSEVISSTGGVLSMSGSGAMMTLRLTSNYLPHWSTTTIARQGSNGLPDGFPDSPPQQIKEIQIPYWPAVILLFAFTAWRGRFVLRDLRKRRRVKSGLCPACAYDLRATPDCCPECGFIVAAGASAD